MPAPLLNILSYNLYFDKKECEFTEFYLVLLFEVCCSERPDQLILLADKNLGSMHFS